MDQVESLKYRILYLMTQGWLDPAKMSIVLDTDIEDIIKILKELDDDGTIKFHTVH